MQHLSAWLEVRPRTAGSLIVVCEAVTPWLTDDGVYLMPESEGAWMQLFRQFCELLNDIGLQNSILPRTVLKLSERTELIRERWMEI
jgi:hypothetical protein